MSKIVILGVLLANRTVTSAKFQEVVSQYGCSIKTRIGLHAVSENKCSTDGVILLELIGSDDEIASIENAIKAIPDAQVQKISFDVK